MGDTGRGSWTSKELGQHIAQERAQEGKLKAKRELIYEHLLKDFAPVAQELGGWMSEGGVFLDGKLWALSQHIAEGDFELIE